MNAAYQSESAEEIGPLKARVRDAQQVCVWSAWWWSCYSRRRLREGSLERAPGLHQDRRGESRADFARVSCLHSQRVALAAWREVALDAGRAATTEPPALKGVRTARGRASGNHPYES